MQSSISAPRNFLGSFEWKSLQEVHIRKISPWIDQYRDKKRKQIKQPVEDFLFTYYSFPLSRLERWNPGPFVELEGEGAAPIIPEKYRSLGEFGYFLDVKRIRTKDLKRIRWILSLLQSVDSRPPLFKCFGLHEWAMVYDTDRVRHESIPLRLSTQEIQSVVDGQKPCCTHYDAFRFFTEKAKPLNTHKLAQESREQYEQEACVHFSMDLYKWSYKLYPWISSSMIYEAFQLALEARTLDMRASPYDLKAFGYSPIAIETQAGRVLYASEQNQLMVKARSIRKSIIFHCKKLIDSVESPDI